MGGLWPTSANAVMVTPPLSPWSLPSSLVDPPFRNPKVEDRHRAADPFCTHVARSAGESAMRKKKKNNAKNNFLTRATHNAINTVRPRVFLSLFSLVRYIQWRDLECIIVFGKLVGDDFFIVYYFLAHASFMRCFFFFLL